MKDVVHEAKHDHDLDRITPSKTFMTRMEHCIKRKKLDYNHGLTWKVIVQVFHKMFRWNSFRKVPAGC